MSASESKASPQPTPESQPTSASAPTPAPHPSHGHPLDPSLTLIHLGPEILVIRDRYEALSIANDVMIGLWFVVGSALFFSESTTMIATVLFLVGSVQMIIRPAIRLARRVHLRRRGYFESATQQDF